MLKICVILGLLVFSSCITNNDSPEGTTFVKTEIFVDQDTLSDIQEDGTKDDIDVVMSESVDSLASELSDIETQYSVKAIHRSNFLDWFKLFKKDKDYFIREKKDELTFFQIWSDYLYGTNYTNGEYDNLFLCVDGKEHLDILDEWSNKVCRGEDKYIKSDGENYKNLKLSFVVFKKAYLGEKPRFKNFEEYMIIRIISGEYKSIEEINQEIKKYNDAYEQGNCAKLTHDSLIKDCNNGYKKDY